MLTQQQVLVLNYNYEPLNVTTAKRAISMLWLGKVEVLQTNTGQFRSASVIYELPSVVRLNYQVSRPHIPLKVTKRNIIARDNFTCQYCGVVGSGGGGGSSTSLTIDHLIPKNRGGKTDWANLVCCCVKCNRKKGHRTLQEAGMKLLRQPKQPKYMPYISLQKLVLAYRREEWKEYLLPWLRASGLL